jgi:hypothetical protein
MIRIRVTGDIMLQALGFPKGTSIERIKSYDGDLYAPGVYEMVISNPDLPKVDNGGIIPEAAPIFENVAVNGVRTETRLKSWGIK